MGVLERQPETNILAVGWTASHVYCDYYGQAYFRIYIRCDIQSEKGKQNHSHAKKQVQR